MESITNAFGEKIKVTDCEKAIQQAEFCRNSPFSMDRYVLTNQLLPEALQMTVGEYYKDMLPKLRELLKSSADIPDTH